MKYLLDYLSGRKVLVQPNPQSDTMYQLALDYLSGQIALVLVQGVTPPATDGGWGLLLALRNTE